MQKTPTLFITLLSLSVHLGGCSEAPTRPKSLNGGVSAGEATSAGPSTVVGENTPVNLVCNPTAELDPGLKPVRRLSRSQYINSVRDLLGNMPQLDTILTNQSSAMPLGTSLSIASSGDVTAYRDAANTLSAAFVANKDLYSKVVICAAGTDARSCSSKVIGRLASKAYRSLVSSDDVNRLMLVYDVGAAVSQQHGIEMALASILQAPRFLYQVEVGTGEKLGSKALKLNDYEVATRLALTIWDSAPDDKLLGLAAEGKLKTTADVKQQITWMLADPKGSTLMRRFLESLTNVDNFASKEKDMGAYPEWTPTMKAAIRSQATAFFDNVVMNEGATLAAVLGSKTVMMNKTMASVYGVPSTETTFKPVLKNDSATSGILSLPALLTRLAGPTRSSPTNRGRFIREVLLCQPVAPPPSNTETTIPESDSTSTRDAIQQTTASPQCAGCHKLMDPIGFTFENYDGIGRFRSNEKGLKIDISGEILFAPGLEGKVNSLAELGDKLIKSPEVEDCVSKQLYRFIQARLEQSPDACAIQETAKAFKESGGKLNTLPAAIIGSDSILYRQPIN